MSKIDDFIQFAKTQDVTIKAQKSDTPDTFDRLFGDIKQQPAIWILETPSENAMTFDELLQSYRKMVKRYNHLQSIITTRMDRYASILEANCDASNTADLSKINDNMMRALLCNASLLDQLESKCEEMDSLDELIQSLPDDPFTKQDLVHNQDDD